MQSNAVLKVVNNDFIGSQRDDTLLVMMAMISCLKIKGMTLSVVEKVMIALMGMMVMIP